MAHASTVLVYDVVEKETISLSLVCKFNTNGTIVSLQFCGYGSIFAFTFDEMKVGIIHAGFPSPLQMHTLMARTPNAHVARSDKTVPELDVSGKNDLPFSSIPFLLSSFDLAEDVENSSFFPLHFLPM